MSRIFTMPELAESVVEGEVVQWLAAVGEVVQENQPLVEVMTDKVTVEVVAPYTGVLEAHLAAEGDVVPVGQPLARFADGPDGAVTAVEPDAAGEAGQGEADDGSARTLFTAHDSGEGEALPRIRKPGANARPAARETTAATGPYGRPLAVPAARRKAREAGIDLTAIQGSGPAGRIRVSDVEAALARTGASQAATRHGTTVAPELAGPGTTRVPLRGMRRAIARQMMDSHLGTARALQVDEADVSDLVALRNRLKPRAAEQGVSLSYLPFILAALTRSLAAFPMLNARFDASDESIVLHDRVNLGLAVATDAGLVVPVLRNADQLGVMDLAREVTRLATAARDGTLDPADVQGGTFSVTNIGTIGGLFSLPVINAPEAAILGVHAIKKRPVVMPDDSIAARHMLYLSLAFDHRLADGAEVAHFSNHLIDQLQDPETLLL